MTADWGLITAAGEPMTADGVLITGAGKATFHKCQDCYESVSFTLFFLKAIPFFDCLDHLLLLFFFFLFIFALTFHKCQIVMKAILSFFDFWTIFLFLPFSFHLCFDIPQMSVCYESDSFHFDFLRIFWCGRRAALFSVGSFFCFCFVFLLLAFFGFLFDSCSGRRAALFFPSGFLCAFLFVFSFFYESDSFFDVLPFF